VNSTENFNYFSGAINCETDLEPTRGFREFKATVLYTDFDSS
jgi:hypothetical protein